MMLTHIRIQNFRSILDSGKVSVGDLCCLVGKNEAGKTATLTALQSIRPYGVEQTSFDVTEDYPRRFVTRYSERHPDLDALAVETWWELSDEAHQLLSNEFGENAISSREFTISKRYKQRNTSWNLPINEPTAIANAIAAHRLDAIEKQVVGAANTARALIDAIASQDSPTEKLSALSKRFSDFREQSVICKGIDLIEHLVPTFFLYLSL